jgi:hypothetical protein
MKHLKFHASLVVLPLVTALALVCCSQGNKPTSAEAFLTDYNNDRDAAYQKYKDKDILLTGKAIPLSEHGAGRNVLGLIGGVKATEMILCEFAETSPQIGDARKIKDGERVEVKGRLSDLPQTPPMVYLEDCQLQQ